MNINDYKKAVDNYGIRPELKNEIIEKCCAESRRKIRFSRKKLIPIMAAAVIDCVSITAAFAGDFSGIFKKQNNFEMSITSQPEIQNESVPILNASLKKWNENVIHSLFADGKTVKESTEYPSDKNPDATRKCFEYSDNTVLCYEDGDISWHRRSDYDYSYIQSVVTFGLDSGEVLFPDESLNNFDRQEAVNTAKNTFDALGIPVCNEQVIALDSENLIKNDSCRNENGERIDKHGDVLPEWGYEQEAYMIIYNLDSDNLPVSSKAFYSDNFYTEGSEIYAIVSRSGLEYISARYIYDFSEGSKADVNICSVEEAAEAVNSRFGIKASVNPTFIQNCKLIYVAVSPDDESSYELHPYWEFYSTEKIPVYNEKSENVIMDYHDTIFVNAETCTVLE